MQVLAPGEVAEAGNIANRGRMTGAGYYPVKHTAGAAFTITVNSCDDNYNIVNDTPIVKIITDDVYDT
ncbi:MAG: hypothetical protein A2297_07450 [Elusimicrobia bacterium RIFOXYB2_FULL_48_7]|nr:MAG: hypothetical protein A2297_07450 [Elusimicrobia bacterium RIFOXYB2_FULL_48_7]